MTDSILKPTVIDAYVQLTFYVDQYHWRNPGSDEHIRDLNRAIRDFEEFLRDHRSQDVTNMEVIRVYRYKCPYCGYLFNENTSQPDCCEKAMNVWSPITEEV